MPDVIVIAGPNGAGKTTLAPQLLKQVFGEIEFVNADLIADESGTEGKRRSPIEAGRIMLRRMNRLRDKGSSFSFETTLSTRFYAGWLKAIQKRGYTVQILFLWLPDVDLSIQRVAERVRVGGHDIPIDTIRRRFSRGKANLLNIYLKIADVWRVYDASMETPNVIAFRDSIVGEKVLDDELWQRVTN